MSVVINEDKDNIKSIMMLVGGENGSGGLVSTLDSIKSEIKTSTSTSKGKLEGLSITTSNDPVVLAFKDAVGSTGEIFEPYVNIDKSLDSGSFVTLIDLVKEFYTSLKTLKEKIEENESIKAHNDSINSTIGSDSKSWSKLNEYNAGNGADLRYKSEINLSSYKTNCESYLSAIQAVTFSFSEADSAASQISLVSAEPISAMNADGSYNLDYLNENSLSVQAAMDSYNETGEYPEIIYDSTGVLGDGMFLVLDKDTGMYNAVSATDGQPFGGESYDVEASYLFGEGAIYWRNN